LNFTAGLQRADLPLVRASASEDFSRYAWDHLDDTTDFEPNPASFFKARLNAISLSGDRADVVYGDDRRGARFSLVKEHGEFRVDDVTLIAGRDRQIPLKRTIRTQLAQGGLR
jgi:hypothetical protein